MKKPVLVIMAAGMGSRYGGLKQIDPIDSEGHIIMDFSIYDAQKAGFEKVIFIIKKENEEDFKNVIGRRIEEKMDVSYAYQDMKYLPEGFAVPEGRKKPWGTAHAVLCAAPYIDGPFVVINADDYYGRHALEEIYAFLMEEKEEKEHRYGMVAYQLKNTITDNGYVSRGVCSVNRMHQLVDVTERTHIEKKEGKIVFTEDDGKSWTELADSTPVSMNMWGFEKSILSEIKYGFTDFLEQGLKENPLKCEYFLPSVVSRLLREGKATVDVLQTDEKWYGVTYKEDKSVIEEAIIRMKSEGIYPEKLWE